MKHVIRALLACGAVVVGAACSSGEESAVTPTKNNPVNGGPKKQVPKDGVKNGNETDVDCGGDSGAACEDGKGCQGPQDCLSGICKNAVCAVPAPDDTVKNGDETDVDCGGTKAPKCELSKGCIVGDDCASSYCNYAGKCVSNPSCVVHHGGDTCGAGADGDPNAKFEDCCIALPAKKADGTTYVVDKYIVTAGRVRAMVESLNGDIKGFVSKLPETNPYWSHAWDGYMPSDKDEVIQALSAYAPLSPGEQVGQGRNGCYHSSDDGSSNGAHTYWASADKMELIGETAPFDPAFTKDILDEKYLNCVDSFMLMAFCIWDGGHLATFDEIATTWINDKNPTGYPWTSKSPNVSISDTNQPQGTDENGKNALDYVSHEFGTVEFDEEGSPFSYWWPTQEKAPTGGQRRLANIPAPGRKPLGNGAYGHADIIGSYQLTQLAKDAPIGTTDAHKSMSVAAFATFEIHGIPKTPVPAALHAMWSYWGAAGRCARTPKK